MYEVGIGEEKITITAESPLNAACLAFKLYLERGGVRTAPLVLSVTDRDDGKETLVFTPVVLADLGMHNESSAMVRQVAQIIEK